MDEGPAWDMPGTEPGRGWVGRGTGLGRSRDGRNETMDEKAKKDGCQGSIRPSRKDWPSKGDMDMMPAKFLDRVTGVGVVADWVMGPVLRLG